MRKIRKIIPDEMHLPLLVAIACNTVTYFGTRLLTAGRIHCDITCALDERIPLVPWTVVIYFGAYLFWIVNYVLGVRQYREKAYRFISADFAAKLVCLICFLAFPTTNVRPEIAGSSIWDTLMRFLYEIDAADNLFPSIHCLTSWFGFIAVRSNERVPKWYRALSLIVGLAICVSTLTTKQHVLADVFAGIALAEGSYRLVEKSGLSRRYRNIMTRLCR